MSRYWAGCRGEARFAPAPHRPAGAERKRRQISRAPRFAGYDPKRSGFCRGSNRRRPRARQAESDTADAGSFTPILRGHSAARVAGPAALSGIAVKKEVATLQGTLRHMWQTVAFNWPAREGLSIGRSFPIKSDLTLTSSLSSERREERSEPAAGTA